MVVSIYDGYDYVVVVSMVVRGKYLYGERSCDIRTAITTIYGYQWSRALCLLTYLALTLYIATKKVHK